MFGLVRVLDRWTGVRQDEYVRREARRSNQTKSAWLAMVVRGLEAEVELAYPRPGAPMVPDDYMDWSQADADVVHQWIRDYSEWSCFVSREARRRLDVALADAVEREEQRSHACLEERLSFRAVSASLSLLEAQEAKDLLRTSGDVLH